MCVCVRQQDRTIEIAVRLSAQQLYHVTPVLEEIIREIAEEREKGMVNLMVDHVVEVQEHVPEHNQHWLLVDGIEKITK